ncbi:MAG: type II toxin-antitoxin system RelE/ParE family toxin [Proteobacteria bacterium]|nr:type II toxin-antitoxin system RelE/ParE family toxin [Desulfobulbaceae bacterium]MBU4151439.1 type II toxin-antitoxin system RelE/ParE family toxin [Pseudomonadota bacterium]MDP2104973.1 type II toxin-antitoxin system RelE/ParE family toxin [Desulfobulbaceae bacterium]
MSDKIEIMFANSALRDLGDVTEYYRERQVPHVGEKMVVNIINDVELLGEQPDMGRIVPEFDLEYLRELIRPPFRIVYRRDRNKIRIVRVWRSERLMVLPNA